MKNLIFALSIICLFLIACVYFKTGYFETSVSTNKTTFYLKKRNSISSSKYYRDLSGNWVLLDKNIVITEGSWTSTSIDMN